MILLPSHLPHSIGVTIVLLLSFIFSIRLSHSDIFKRLRYRYYDDNGEYGAFPESLREKMVVQSKEMFYFGYDNYMKYAFPEDELNPINCNGRGADWEDPENVNINDALGDYSLTLVDSLDSLAILGNVSEFKHAVKLVIDSVSFDKANTVQVFEATIRILGGLLSAHLLINETAWWPDRSFHIDNYNDELLSLAHDLAARLLPAFENTATGLPYPRVNLHWGVLPDCVNSTCTAGAGSLLLEFGVLSRLTNDPVYETLANRVADILWNHRSRKTGLFGNVINIQSGRWINSMAGLGAGVDSFYEYLLKSYILFGNERHLKMFQETYRNIKKYMRKGRNECTFGTGSPPVYVNVDMNTGAIINNWLDSLQASWAGVQVLAGDVEEAKCSHAFYHALWARYDMLPERFNWKSKNADVRFYPLRPEFAESTYLLYRATKHPYYLHVGREILHSLQKHTRVKCGYATIHDVIDKTHEDRMESFFLSETCKYLYLLFDIHHPLNSNVELANRFIFNTEGHPFRVKSSYRKFRGFSPPVNNNHDKNVIFGSAATTTMSSTSSLFNDTDISRLLRKYKRIKPEPSHIVEKITTTANTNPSTITKRSSSWSSSNTDNNDNNGVEGEFLDWSISSISRLFVHNNYINHSRHPMVILGFSQ